MNIERLREKLAEAGSKFDGHVTTGSLSEQIKILRPFLALLETVKNEHNSNNPAEARFHIQCDVCAAVRVVEELLR